MWQWFSHIFSLILTTLLQRLFLLFRWGKRSLERFRGRVHNRPPTRCDALTYSLFWAEGIWKKSRCRKTLWFTFFYLKMSHKISHEKVTLPVPEEKDILITKTGSGYQSRSVQTHWNNPDLPLPLVFLSLLLVACQQFTAPTKILCLVISSQS